MQAADGAAAGGGDGRRVAIAREATESRRCLLAVDRVGDKDDDDPLRQFGAE